ncbi:prepilin-type N-terminal cleavage/methylation domain-containing protein, partial [Candidatus Parcubacteria bacterium]|nr:prepilin-type N-terminal cleavage/methylation domain-containing protein [Candidatus Parcubacteria bacterium]
AFTLVELLVAIAIIGLLSTIVVVSINSTRIRARDIKRVSDLHQIQLALELFSDSHNQTYPAHDIYDAATLCAGTVNCGLAAPDACGSKRCINPLPVDPAGGSSSKYWYTYTQTAADPTLFHLGANLEEAVDALQSDRDCGDGAGGTCPGTKPYSIGSTPVVGVGILNPSSPDDSNGCQNVPGTDRYCYDITN